MLSVEAAVDRARDLAARPGTAILGITGPPGAGKSTLAATVVAAVPGAVLVGMDGFHLAHSALEALGRVERKGAPDTFDAQGYVALLRRIRDPGRPRGPERPDGADRTVWAPEFRRELEDPVAGAVPIGDGTQLVVTEGNYLLLDRPPWDEVRPLLDENWYVELPDEERRTRLQARHERYGRSAEEAHARTWGSDERNAVLVAASRDRSDLRVSGSRLAARSLD